MAEDVHTGHLPGAIDIASKGIEAGEELFAIIEAVDGDIVEFHVLHTGSIGFEGRVGSPEEAGITWIGPRDVCGFFGEGDVGWDGGVGGTEEFGDGGADAGSTADRAEVIGKPTALALVGLMAVFTTDDGANDHGLVHALGEEGKNFADLDARDIGWDGAKFAANFRGCIRLDFPHILMGRSTTEEDVDNGFMRIADTGCGFGAVEIGE